MTARGIVEALRYLRRVTNDDTVGAKVRDVLTSAQTEIERIMEET